MAYYCFHSCDTCGCNSTTQLPQFFSYISHTTNDLVGLQLCINCKKKIDSFVESMKQSNAIGKDKSIETTSQDA